MGTTTSESRDIRLFLTGTPNQAAGPQARHSRTPALPHSVTPALPHSVTPALRHSVPTKSIAPLPPRSVTPPTAASRDTTSGRLCESVSSARVSRAAPTGTPNQAAGPQARHSRTPALCHSGTPALCSHQVHCAAAAEICHAADSGLPRHHQRQTL
jgi:hypothetical protein